MADLVDIKDLLQRLSHVLLLRRDIANARKHDRRVSRSMKLPVENEIDWEWEWDIGSESESEWDGHWPESPKTEWHSDYDDQPSLPSDFWRSSTCGLSSGTSEK